MKVCAVRKLNSNEKWMLYKLPRKPAVKKGYEISGPFDGYFSAMLKIGFWKKGISKT
ncbi:MAG: hypothetical protein PHD04_00940 [Candidatus Pacebacteria bacterium]|nr:hypothetical protein [Candidatus Paceibacterota bacterium]